MLGLISASIVAVTFDALEATVARVAKLESWLAWPIVVAGLGLGYKLGPDRLAAFLGVKRIWTYPPLWLAAWLGLIALVALWATVPESAAFIGMHAEATPAMCRVMFALIGLLLWAFCLFLSLSLDLSTTTTESAPRQVTQADAEIEGFQAIVGWLKDDSPIDQPDLDRFGHYPIAQRIANRLVTGKASREASIAVLGPVGSGKTSVRKLVEHELETVRSTDDIRLVPVNLWPFETREAAVNRILAALIDELKREINVIGLRGLTSDYAHAIEGFSRSWGRVARLWTTTDPSAIVQRLDDAATAIGIRLVLWVEDLERVPAEGSSPHVTAHSAVKALLHQLDELNAITVVIASTDLGARFDIEKVARFVEQMPSIDDERCARLLHQFRTGCRQELGAFIDPADPAVRSKLDQVGEWQGQDLIRAFTGTSVTSINDALVQLCRYPRQMKQALRACLDTWKPLRGEIDFDDLLAMSLLKQASPDVFELFVSHVDDLRADVESQVGKGKELRATFRKQLESKSLNDTALTVITKILDSVFPESRSARHHKPQGFAVTHPRDYWQRFLARPELQEDERDQPILEMVLLEEADEHRIDTIATLMADSVRSAPTVVFCDIYWKFANVLPLLDCVISRLTEQPSKSWGDSYPRPLVNIWNLLRGKYRSGDFDAAALFDLLTVKLEESVPKNLSLAVELEHWFATRTDDLPNWTNHHDHQDLVQGFQRRLRELLTEHYGGHPDLLAATLATGHKETLLLHACWGLDRIRRHEDSGTPMEEWDGFRDTILQAAKLDPTAVLPQLAWLICDESPTYRFSEERAERLFERDVVLDLFARHDHLEITSGPYEAVRRAARAAHRAPAPLDDPWWPRLSRG